MRVIFAEAFYKATDKYVDGNEVNRIKRINTILKQLNSIESSGDYLIRISAIKSLGFKKLESTHPVYAFDLDSHDASAGAGLRILVSFNLELPKFVEKYSNKNGEVKIIFHLIADHDGYQGQSAMASTVDTTNNGNEIDAYELLSKKDQKSLERSCEAKTKYEYSEEIGQGQKRQKLLPISKENISSQFLYCDFSLFVMGIAGSGKTLLCIDIMQKLVEFYPGTSILYVTLAKELSGYTEARCVVNNNKNITFSTLKEIVVKDMLEHKEGKKEILFETFSTFELFCKESTEPNPVKYVFDDSRIQKFINDNLWQSIYSEIYGLLMGGKAKNNEDSFMPLLPAKQYLEMRSEICDSDKGIIYQIAKRYNDYIISEGIYSLNSEVKNAVKHNISKYDYIIIDEVQDFTECQIAFLTGLAKDKRRIFFSGDENQSVYPTFFQERKMLNFLRSDLEIDIANIERLNENFRNPHNITKLINYVKDEKKKYCVAQKDVVSQPESSIEGSILDSMNEFTNINRGIVYSCKTELSNVLKLTKSANLITLVSEERYNYLEKEECDMTNILTVQNSKGLEFENVVLYNLLSDYRNEFSEIYANKKYQNKKYEYIFNLFYVGVSRAIYKLVIIEDDQTVALYANIIENQRHLNMVEKIEDIELNLLTTAHSYLETARIYLENFKYAQALSNFIRAEAANDYYNYEGKINEGKIICQCYINNPKTTYSQLAQQLEKVDNLEKASEFYLYAKEYDRYALMQLKLSKDGDYKDFKEAVIKYNIDFFNLYNYETSYYTILNNYIKNRIKTIDNLYEDQQWYSDYAKKALFSIDFK